ncbi:flagellar protein FlaG [Legionella worsleiensis]|uniref:FlaG protein n=1 Tax=Legionella worsleiensis TaxID=45076 RepID=A0A0W1AL00_9GAMM|nr:flagellar protein FlaG [Legionella worsleiensis]KTD82031.1 hypothetical protein Lwor_0334 [Legionella worsleiensis]STY30305.1 Uncharacterised protein [Legionella worsleiensis]
MKIESVPSVNQINQSEFIHGVDEVIKAGQNKPVQTMLDAETRQTLDEATGLIQTIVSDKLSDKVIRKMPSDEYLHLLSLLDEIISGSIDKHV